jgi:starch phosphorylase
MLKPFRSFTVTPSLPPQLQPLHELAYNLWWTWNLDAVDLFRRLDRDLWETSGHNPVLMLGKISQSRLEEAVEDDGFVAQMMRIYQAYNRYMGHTDTWFQTQHPEIKDKIIAYFSAEFGITECLAMYSGGLGILAGDHLKSASDLGLPMVGVGLLYQEGYFRQYLNADGWQQESYPLNDFYNLPVQLERDSQGQPVIVSVEFLGRDVQAHVWRAQVGRISLYLLDTNLDVNRPEDRDITDRLYGGDLTMRIQQEMILGIGGIRALRKLGIRPTTCHMNDGHPAFQSIERLRLAMAERGLSFAEARELVAAGDVFTTHTPVPAGIDMFPVYLIDEYLGRYYAELGIGRDQFLALGRPPNTGHNEVFSMAVLALKLSAACNGVSRRHGEVARDMWRELWPGTPTDEVPITSITNGIHMASFLSGDMSSLLLRYLGPRWGEHPEDRTLWQRADRIPDEELWRTHERRRERLVSVARRRLEEQLSRRGATPGEIAEATEVLNPEALTICFARRFATYKRALLLFRDPERLARILNQPGRPVQLIFGGKAHPRDNPGKEFIRQLIHLTRRDDLRRRVLFLEDYEVSLARYMVQGADVWLNTPRLGNEASGTSGMKAAGNGVLNLSSFDGWWCEGYTPEVGWRIGSGEVYEDERYGDEVEAQALYDLLEKDVIPLFYQRGSDGLPRAWISKMKSAIRDIGPYFNTHRMVQEYCERLYVPAVERFDRLSANEAERARTLAAWLQNTREVWGAVRIREVRTADGATVGGEMRVNVHDPISVVAELDLAGLSPEDVLVQLYHGPITPQGEIAPYEVSPMLPTVNQEVQGAVTYEGTLRSDATGLHGYTVRVLPRHPDLATPHVPGLTLWAS